VGEEKLLGGLFPWKEVDIDGTCPVKKKNPAK